MKRLLDAYLAELEWSPVHTMEDVIAFNKAYSRFELPPGAICQAPLSNRKLGQR